MKCKECIKEGKVSTITLGPLTTTLIGGSTGSYDEDGNFHGGEDPNSSYQEYTCSNGHTWEEKQ